MDKLKCNKNENEGGVGGELLGSSIYLKLHFGLERTFLMVNLSFQSSLIKMSKTVHLQRLYSEEWCLFCHL